MDSLFSPNVIAFSLIAVVYVLGRIVIEVNEKRAHPLSDGEHLGSIAADRKSSEYDIFFSAAENWHVPASRVEADFRRYLADGTLPHYLRDFLRRNRPVDGVHPRNRLNPGGDLPTSWSA
jgi:hypothetical protein